MNEESRTGPGQQSRSGQTPASTGSGAAQGGKGKPGGAPQGSTEKPGGAAQSGGKAQPEVRAESGGGASGGGAQGGGASGGGTPGGGTQGAGAQGAGTQAGGDKAAAAQWHTPFQSAAERYYNEVTAVWGDAQRRAQELQLDFMRVQLDLVYRQPSPEPEALQEEYQSLQEKYYRECTELAADDTPARRLSAAFTEYGKDLRNGLAQAELDPLTLGLVAQHLYGVAQFAEQVRQSVSQPVPVQAS